MVKWCWKIEIGLFLCISMTNNVKLYKKINGRVQTFRLSVLPENVCMFVCFLLEGNTSSTWILFTIVKHKVYQDFFTFERRKSRNLSHSGLNYREWFASWQIIYLMQQGPLGIVHPNHRSALRSSNKLLYVCLFVCYKHRKNCECCPISLLIVR